MAAVDPDLGAPGARHQPAIAQLLQAAGPFDRVIAFSIIASVTKTRRLDRADGRGGIGILVAPGKPRQRQVGETELVLIDQRPYSSCAM
jgi:hypothetical protein